MIRLRLVFFLSLLALTLPEGILAAETPGDCAGDGVAIVSDLGTLPSPADAGEEEVPEWLQGLSPNLKHFDDDNFKAEVLDHEGLVLMDFWASLCAPCRDMLPILSELSDEHQGSVKVGHLDILEARETPKKYGITMGPHLVLFKDGKIIAQHEGFASKEELEAMIAKATGEQPESRSWFWWLGF